MLLLTEHSNEAGAHGYILNRPLGKKVGDVLPSEDFEGISDVEVYFGGPVSQEQLTFAALSWDDASGNVVVESHLSTALASERLADGASIRAFVGYAGWAGGQLEAELQQRAWIASKPYRQTVTDKSTETLWADILKSMGPYYSLLAAAPEDPSLN